MYFWISVAMAMTIILPAVAGMARYNNLHLSDRLFIHIIWLGMLAELGSISLILVKGSNAEIFNAYVLIESVLLLFLFRKWDIIGSRRAWISLVAGVLAVWCIDNIYLRNISNFFGIFNVYVALTVMFFSVNCITKRITYNNDNILTDGRFLVATGLLLHYSIKAVTDSFFIIDLQMSTELAQKILLISSVVNVFSNLLYLGAIICFNRNQKFTLEYW